MRHVLSLFVLCSFAASIVGCGGSPEKPTATTTPKADPEKMKAEMMKSFEKNTFKKSAKPPEVPEVAK